MINQTPTNTDIAKIITDHDQTRRRNTTVIISLVCICLAAIIGIYLLRGDTPKQSMSVDIVKTSSLDNQTPQASQMYIQHQGDSQSPSFSYPKEFIFTDTYQSVKAGTLSPEVLPYGQDTISALSLHDPASPKHLYDCCYSPEETERLASHPTITVTTFKTTLASDMQEYIAQSSYSVDEQNLFDDLVKNGLTQKQAYTMLIYTPTSLNQEASQRDEDVTELGCHSSEIIRIDNRIAVSNKQCFDGGIAPASSFVVFAPVGDVITIVRDDQSYYSQDSTFINVINSFSFNN